jgi:hypothetical protein
MVFKRKRSPYLYYRFTRDGVTVYVNTKQKSQQTAIDLENAHRTRLAKGEAGLRTDTAPTLKQFEDRFIKFVETRSADQPRTIQFYKSTYNNLLAFPPLANQRIDRIDESLIEKYVQHRQGQKVGRTDPTGKLAVATVNRDLATLRRLLHLAHEWKLITRVPKVQLRAGEHRRDLDLPPFLTQAVKTQNPFKGELSHGVVEKDFHQGVQAGRGAAAGARSFHRRGRAGVGGKRQRAAPLAA